MMKVNDAELSLLRKAWHGNQQNTWDKFCDWLQTWPAVHVSLLKFLWQNAPSKPDVDSIDVAAQLDRMNPAERCNFILALQKQTKFCWLCGSDFSGLTRGCYCEVCD